MEAATASKVIGASDIKRMDYLEIVNLVKSRIPKLSAKKMAGIIAAEYGADCVTVSEQTVFGVAKSTFEVEWSKGGTVDSLCGDSLHEILASVLVRRVKFIDLCCDQKHV